MATTKDTRIKTFAATERAPLVYHVPVSPKKRKNKFLSIPRTDAKSIVKQQYRREAKEKQSERIRAYIQCPSLRLKGLTSTPLDSELDPMDFAPGVPEEEPEFTPEELIFNMSIDSEIHINEPIIRSLSHHTEMFDSTIVYRFVLYYQSLLWLEPNVYDYGGDYYGLIDNPICYDSFHLWNCYLETIVRNVKGYLSQHPEIDYSSCQMLIDLFLSEGEHTDIFDVKHTIALGLFHGGFCNDENNFQISMKVPIPRFNTIFVQGSKPYEDSETESEIEEVSFSIFNFLRGATATNLLQESRDLMKSVDSSVNNIGRIFAEDKVANVKNVLDTCQSVLTNTQEAITSAEASLTNTIGKLEIFVKQYAPLIFGGAIFAGCFTLYAATGKALFKFCALLGLVVMLPFCTSIEHIVSFLPQFDSLWKPRSQGGTSDLLGAFLVAASVPGVTAYKMPTMLFDKISKIDKFSTNFDKIYDVITDLLYNSASFVLTKVVRQPHLLDYLKNEKAILSDIEEMDKFVLQVNTGELPETNATFLTCKHWMEVNRKLARSLGRSDPQFMTLLQSNMRALELSCKKLRVFSDLAESDRMEPYFLCVVGRPGVGKTVSSVSLCKSILPHIVDEQDKKLSEESSDTFVYHRIPSKYWEGYNHKTLITRFDDLGQMVEVPGSEQSEAMDIIRAVNNSPWCLPTAFENKGTVYFESKLLIATSNSHQLQAESINDVGALVRRVALMVVQFPLDEYCLDPTAPLDSRKLKRGIEGEENILNYSSIMRFAEVAIDPSNPSGPVQYTGRQFTYDELVSEVVKGVKHRCRVYADLKNAYKYEHIKAIKLANIEKIFGSSDDDDYGKFCKIIRSQPKFVAFMQMRFETVFEGENFLNFMQSCYNDLLHRELIIQCIEETSKGGFDDYVMKLKSHPDSFPVHGMFAVDKKIPLINLDGIRQQLAKFQQYEFIKFLSHINNHWAVRMMKMSLPVLGMFMAWYYEVPSKIKEYFTTTTVIDDYSQQSVSSLARGLRLKRNDKFFDPPVNTVQTGFTHDRNGYSILKKVLMKSMCEVVFVGAGGLSCSLGFAVCLKLRKILLPAHFITTVEKDVVSKVDLENGHIILRFWRDTERYVDQFVTIGDFTDPTYYSRVPNSKDLAVMDVSGYNIEFQERPSIISYLASRKTHELCKPVTGTVAHRGEGHFNVFSGNMSRLTDAITINDGPTSWTLDKAYTYCAGTDVGDCGALLFCLNSKISTEKIFGMHVAGCTLDYSSKGRESAPGFSEPLIKEDILVACDSTNRPSIVFQSNKPYNEVEEPVNLANGQIEHIGQINGTIPVHTTTSFRKSVFHGQLGPVVTKPAFLKPFGDPPIDPYAVGLAKYGASHTFIPKHKVGAVTLILKEFLNYNSKDDIRRVVMTPDQAIKGDEYLGIGSLPRDTSAGYPHVLHKVKKRYPWTGTGEEYDLDNPAMTKLRSDVKDIEEEARNGIRRHWLIIDHLKDEDLPSEKVDKGKARIFCACPFEKLVIDKMYFGAFVQWLTNNRVNNGMATGVNVYGHEWSNIATKLLKFNIENNIGAGDFSGFDGSQQGVIHQAILKIINDWYDDGPENAKIREVLYADVYNSIHVRNKNVYEWWGGMTSGFYMTASLNCMYNLFAFIYAYGRLSDFNLSHMSTFREYVYLIVQGDDNVYSVATHLRECFTEGSLSEAFAEIGLKYTTESKDTEFADFLRNIDEVTFLKRRFRKTGFAHYDAPLELVAITSSLDYTKQDRTVIQEGENADWALREISLHGEEVYNTIGKKVISVCDSYSYSVKFREYEVVRSQVANYDFVL